MPEAARVVAPAKVNLRLRILARQASGFHSLETIFCAVSLADTLRIRRSSQPGIRLVVEGDIEMGPLERNLAVRAAERFYREMGRSPAIRIELAKRIPAAAGLGGGSSDAAATLRALNMLHDNPFSPPALLEMGSELGSDVPFFLCGSPLALAWGRGERLLALAPLPARSVLIVHPGLGMRTADAFRRIAEGRTEDHRSPAFVMDRESLAEWDSIAHLAENNFEPVARELVPRFSEIRRGLIERGAEIAMLAGSGSCAFGVFASRERRDAASAHFADRGFPIWEAETLDSSPEPVLR